MPEDKKVESQENVINKTQNTNSLLSTILTIKGVKQALDTIPASELEGFEKELLQGVVGNIQMEHINTTKPSLSKITVNELIYQKSFKFDFIFKVRDVLKTIVEELTEAESIEDPEEKKDDVGQSLYSFFIPFCDDILSPGLDGEFGNPINGPNLEYMCERYLDLVTFLRDIFIPASQLLREAYKTKKYDDLIDKYDKIIFKKSIQISTVEEAEPVQV